MLAIRIKDLEVQLSNLNLLVGKNAIQFESLIQKDETDKQMAGTIYFFYLSANNFIGAYAWLRKTWAEISLPHEDWIVAIFKKRVIK